MNSKRPPGIAKSNRHGAAALSRRFDQGLDVWRWYQQWHEPEVPYCLIGKISWGVTQVIRVPEDRAHLYVGKYGWMRLIGDSEFPVVLYDGPHEDIPAQSNPRRMLDDGA